MNGWQIIGLGMLLAPVLWCLGQIFVPLFKMFDRNAWLIFGVVIAWYGVATIFLSAQS